MSDAEQIKAIMAREIDGMYCLPGINEVSHARDAADKVYEALAAAGYRFVRFRVVERAPLVFQNDR